MRKIEQLSYCSTNIRFFSIRNLLGLNLIKTDEIIIFFIVEFGKV